MTALGALVRSLSRLREAARMTGALVTFLVVAFSPFVMLGAVFGRNVHG